MKYVITLALLMTGCGRFHAKTYDAPVAPAPTILSNWVAGPATIPALDFSKILSNQIQPTDTVLTCPIPSGGDASGVDAPAGFHNVMKSQVYIDGSDTFGIIQFGKQPHDHTQTGECYIVGQEAYYYSVEGNELTLCDIQYKVCLTLTKAQ